MTVRLKANGSTTLLTLDRPDKLNALNYATIDELQDRLVELEREDDVRAVVLTGSGRAFSAGADISDLADSIRGRWVKKRHLAVAFARAGGLRRVASSSC